MTGLRFRPVVRTAARSLFLVAAAPTLRADDAKPPLDATTRDYDQIDLALDIDLDMDRGTLTGTATHKVAALRDDLRVVRMHCEDMKVQSATADGAACKVTQDDKILSIELDRPRKKDEPVRIANHTPTTASFMIPSP